MDKIDIFMAFLGFLSYVAIMVDLKNYERKMAAFEAIQERRRKYAELQAERRKAELALEKSIEESLKNKLTMGENLSSKGAMPPKMP